MYNQVRNNINTNRKIKQDNKQKKNQHYTKNGTAYKQLYNNFQATFKQVLYNFITTLNQK